MPIKRVRFLPALKASSRNNNVCVLFHYTKFNKYSIHALVASVDIVLGSVDMVLAECSFESLLKLAKYLSERYKWVVLAFSISTARYVDEFKEYEYINSRKAKNVVSVAGGPHPSGDPCGTLDRGFDFVFVGEAEVSFPSFLKELVEGDPFKVRGLAFKRCDEYFFTGVPLKIDLDDFCPIPYWRDILGPIEIMRGCTFTCFFCQTPFLHGTCPRFRSIDFVIEIAESTFNLGAGDIRFIAPNSIGYLSCEKKEVNFAALSKLLEELDNRIRKKGGRVFFGTFPSEVRPDYLTEDVAELLRKYVNNKRIVIGAQTGSDFLLKRIHREHTVDDVIKAVECARRVGFGVDVDFIFGLPGETEEDLELTLKLILLLLKMKARVHAHVFMPLPGSPFRNAPPGRIDARIRRVLYKLIGEKGLFGQWENQERISKAIAALRERGIIKTNFKLKRA